MKTKRKQFIFAVVVGLLAVGSTKLYVNSVRDQYKPKEFIQIVRAKKPIQAGTPLLRQHVEKVKVPKTYTPLVAIRVNELDSYLGQPVAVDVPSGDYLLETYFEEQRIVGATLSDQISGDNMRAITIPVDQTNSLSSSLVSGDRIDILFTFTVPQSGEQMTIVLLQNVQVISTGAYSAAAQELGRKGGRAGNYSTVTLLLSARDAMRLNFARDAGRISVLLRNSHDNEQVELQPVSGLSDLLSSEERELFKQAAVADRMSDEEREAMNAQLKQIYEANGLKGAPITIKKGSK